MRYTAFDKINLFFRTYIQMFGNIIRPASWAPFLYLATLQLIGLILITWFSMPGWKSLIKPILSLILPNQSFHFPQYLLVMPRVFADYDNYILGPTAWIIFSAVAVYVIGGMYQGKRWRTSDGFSLAFRSYFKLLVIWLVEMLLVFAVFKILSILLVEAVYGSPRRIMALKIGLQLAAFIPSAFLIYAIPSIIIGKRSLITAFRESLSLCSHNFFMTYFIILLPAIIRLVFDILIKDFGPRIIFTMNPDIIVVLMVLKIIAGIGINLLILGSATYIYRTLAD